ncbi:MAG: altronate oxidoreductase [Paenibacillus sp.]|nr:altronate oxidoreductase [Paenibacillus sp.]
MNVLNRQSLTEADRNRYEAAAASPVKILQIGEGNFLRGFVDWMVQVCRDQGLYEGSIAVTQPRPTGKPKIEALARQDGLYTLVTRGIAAGEQVEKQEIITVFSQVFDPYSDWAAFLALAASPDLQVVVSNTTEAGLVYRPESFIEGMPVESFPGKLTVFLYKRFEAFHGSAEHGLIMLPCELLERNGDELKACVLRYIADWSLPEAFRQWVLNDNRFLNSLVDRIVTGFPSEQAEQWFSEWGYKDELLNTAEPYHFWAIEGEAELGTILPFEQAGLNVVWTDDLKPYQLRKVRILNGAHTLMTPLGLLNGFEQVREVMEHPDFGAFVRAAVQEEMIPTLPFPEEDMLAFAAAVFERFHNPHIRHRLADIAMNSISKFKVRLLPALLYAVEEQGHPVPTKLTRSFAALLRYYKVERGENGTFVGRTLAGTEYTVRDDVLLLTKLADVWAASGNASSVTDRQIRTIVERLLGLTDVWGRDLTAVEGLVEAVSEQWTRLQWRSEAENE